MGAGTWCYVTGGNHDSCSGIVGRVPIIVLSLIKRLPRGTHLTDKMHTDMESDSTTRLR